MLFCFSLVGRLVTSKVCLLLKLFDNFNSELALKTSWTYTSACYPRLVITLHFGWVWFVTILIIFRTNEEPHKISLLQYKTNDDSVQFDTKAAILTLQVQGEPFIININRFWSLSLSVIRCFCLAKLEWRTEDKTYTARRSFSTRSWSLPRPNHVQKSAAYPVEYQI